MTGTLKRTRRLVPRNLIEPAPPKLPLELGALVRARRESLGFTKKGLADKAGKVREVIYRIEGGQDVSVSSLLDVLRVLGLKLAIEPAGIPRMEDVSRAFNLDGDDAA
jgi:transcriptional regulator with XRE-family HTH domain